MLAFFIFWLLMSIAFLVLIMVDQVRDLRPPKDRKTRWSWPSRIKKPKKMRRGGSTIDRQTPAIGDRSNGPE